MKNIKDMSNEYIEHRLITVTSEIADIKTQIANAKSTAAATGEYSDRVWFNKAHTALRLKGREHQELQLEFGRRRKEERRTYSVTLGRIFIGVARAQLDYETFMSIMDKAVERINKEELNRVNLNLDSCD
jgi:ribosomal protein L20